MAPPRTTLDSPPALPDDLAEEILLRLPPDYPSCLVRASVVCKAWRRLVSHPNFLRRLYKLHRTPPVLGFFRSFHSINSFGFVPTTRSAFSFPLPVPDSRYWSALDYRHGRALFGSDVGKEGQDFLVWEPITGDQRLFSVPAAPYCSLMNATVLCAADGCGHGDCHGGPFRVVFVYINLNDVRLTTVCVYSSATGSWGDLSSVVYEPVFTKPSVLAGKSLMYFHSMFDHRILEYDLAGRGLSVINLPDMLATCNCKGEIFLMPTKEGGLGCAGVKETWLGLWSREAGDNGDARWVQSRAVELRNILPVDALPASRTVDVIGFAEEANVIFLSTAAGVFAIDLESERARKVYENWRDVCEPLIPFTSFYIPALVQLNLGREKDRGPRSPRYTFTAD